MNKKFYFLILIPISYLISYLTLNYPVFVENFYSNSFNKGMVQILSKLTGILPFSLFEFLIVTGSLALLCYILFIIYLLLTQTEKLSHLVNALANLSMMGSILYFLFMFLWGLNYNRVPFYESGHFPLEKYSTIELGELYSYLIQQTNDLKLKTESDASGVFDYLGAVTDIFEAAPDGYLEAAKIFPTLSGNYGLPKPISFSEILNYTMITGIYSPFTSEANVNIAVPEVTLLFTTMHEMAHQRGYASEDEANLIAFITCISHPDVSFQYAGYLSALGYVNSALARNDREQLIELNKELSAEVVTDMMYKSNFWKSYEGPVETIASNVNNTYLQLNGVSDGVKSYGRMVDSLLSYYQYYLKEN